MLLLVIGVVVILAFLVWLEVIPLRSWLYKTYAKFIGNLTRGVMSFLEIAWNILLIIIVVLVCYILLRVAWWLFKLLVFSVLNIFFG